MLFKQYLRAYLFFVKHNLGPFCALSSYGPAQAQFESLLYMLNEITLYPIQSVMIGGVKFDQSVEILENDW